MYFERCLSNATTYYDYFDGQTCVVMTQLIRWGLTQIWHDENKKIRPVYCQCSLLWTYFVFNYGRDHFRLHENNTYKTKWLSLIIVRLECGIIASNWKKNTWIIHLIYTCIPDGSICRITNILNDLKDCYIMLIF